MRQITSVVQNKRNPHPQLNLLSSLDPFTFISFYLICCLPELILEVVFGREHVMRAKRGHVFLA